jgi:hypothetical protein
MNGRGATLYGGDPAIAPSASHRPPIIIHTMPDEVRVPLCLDSDLTALHCRHAQALHLSRRTMSTLSESARQRKPASVNRSLWYVEQV